MEQLLMVLSNAQAGRDDEFNEWYSHVHVRDVMRLSPRAIAVQRFRLADAQFANEPAPAHRYFALYEGDTHGTFTEGHADVFTPNMPISTAFRFDDMRESYYEPLAARVHETDRTGNSDLILERIALGAGGEDFCGWYMDVRLPQLMRLAGVTESVFARVAAEQMLQPNPDSHYMALYRTKNLAATLSAWAAHDAGDMPAGMVRRGCYTPLIPRLSADDVRHPTAAAAARAQAARDGLGPHVYPGFPAEMHGLLNS